MRKVWKDRVGFLNLRVLLRIKSSGWSDPGYASGPPERCREPEGEETREIIEIEIGDITINALREPALLLALSHAAQEYVDCTDERDFEWEESE